MPDRPLFTKAAALRGADVIGDSIADSAAVPALVGKVRLFDNSFVPDSGTERAGLVAAETTLVGYPAGGYSLTDFSNPDVAPSGGAIVTSNMVHVEYASGDPVVIGGYWVEDGAVPNAVREVFIYDPPRSLAALGDGWPLVVQLGYGRNAS